MVAPKSGLLVVISAPSGGGKTTLVNELLSRLPNAKRSITSTTRPPRSTEIPGQDYDFLSDEEFDALIKQNAFAEHAVVHGFRYGSRKDSITKGISRGDILFLTIDVQGAKNIQASFPQSLLIFVSPPDFDILETRLRKRGTESDVEIRKRLENARKEIAQADDFDFKVLNDRLDRAALEIESIIKRRLAT
jgi:guanylate kinase